MKWRVDLGGETPILAECLQAQALWKKLSKNQQAAMLGAYPDKRVVAHPLTLNALERHGLMTGEPKLTEAGRLVAKWNRGAEGPARGLGWQPEEDGVPSRSPAERREHPVQARQRT
jgi:hypothetical protein